MPKFLKIFPLIVLLISSHQVLMANPLLNGLNRSLENSGLENRFNASPAAPSISAREAVGIAERRYGGRAVGAREINTPNGPAYRVRILQDDGKIKNVIIDG
ncbi:PepSY domain-containing protein [Spongiibacter sp. KMU-158]|uniref:PepSY domain-containing protein n=1 Tax=Spongiibacter pelagi TaxID=2760804 RepID=A0A927GVJ2_9GAMM|nr:PepSY domain-containing protein [Spongiibacter pelagi]MBD2858455.1 PepSY domain-containing protein [Spongiibacter pelagi]